MLEQALVCCIGINDQGHMTSGYGAARAKSCERVQHTVCLLCITALLCFAWQTRNVRIQLEAEQQLVALEAHKHGPGSYKQPRSANAITCTHDTRSNNSQLEQVLGIIHTAALPLCSPKRMKYPTNGCLP